MNRTLNDIEGRYVIVPAQMREDWPTFVKVARTVRNFIPTAEGTKPS